MVILISGPTCVGKTTLAHKLMQELHINYLSIDHLKMGLIRTHISQFVGSGFFIDDDDKKITESLWPMIKEIINTVIENKQHLIIEGCYIPASGIAVLETKILSQIIPVFMLFSQDYIAKHYHDRILKYLSISEDKMYDDSYMSQNHLMQLNEQQKNECNQHHLPFFEIDNDFTKELETIVEKIKQALFESSTFVFNDGY